MLPSAAEDIPGKLLGDKIHFPPES